MVVQQRASGVGAARGRQEARGRDGEVGVHRHPGLRQQRRQHEVVAHGGDDGGQPVSVRATEHPAGQDEQADVVEDPAARLVRDAEPPDGEDGRKRGDPARISASRRGRPSARA